MVHGSLLAHGLPAAERIFPAGTKNVRVDVRVRATAVRRPLIARHGRSRFDCLTPLARSRPLLHLPLSGHPAQFELEGSQEGCPNSVRKSPRHHGLKGSGSSSNDRVVGCDCDTWGGAEGCGYCGAVESGSRCVRRLRTSVAARWSNNGVAVCQSPVRENVPPIASAY